MTLSILSNQTMLAAKAKLIAKLDAYKAKWPAEAKITEDFKAFITEYDDCFSRENYTGHVTGSAMVIDDAGRVLLMHHKKLNIWVQPGGHSDGNPNTIDVACREAAEETGLTDLILISEDIFDIDRHFVPARSDEPKHYHYDIRFLLKAPIAENIIANEESNQLEWFKREEVASLNPELSLQRMVQKVSNLHCDDRLPN